MIKKKFIFNEKNLDVIAKKIIKISKAQGIYNNKEFNIDVVKTKICKSFGFESQEHLKKEDRCSAYIGVNVEHLTVENLINLTLIKNDLKKRFSNTDIKLEDNFMIKENQEKAKKFIIDSAYNYSMGSYIQMYNALNNKIINNGNYIQTYEEAIKASEEFVNDIIKRKKIATSNLFEEDILESKKVKGYKWTKCDKIIKSIIDYDESVDDIFIIIKNVKEELKRLNQVTNKITIIKKDIIHPINLLEELPFYDEKNKIITEALDRNNESMFGMEDLSYREKLKRNKPVKKIINKNDIISGSVLFLGMSSSEYKKSLAQWLAQAAKKREPVFLWDTFFYELNSLNKTTTDLLNYSLFMQGIYSKIITIDTAKIDELTDQKIEEYIEDGRTVVFLKASNGINNNYGTNNTEVLNKLERISEILVEKNKKPSHISITGLDILLKYDGNHSFFKNFKENRENKFKKAKLSFSGSALEINSVNCFLLKNINNILVFKTEAFADVLIEHIFKNGKDKPNFINARDIKDLNKDQFIFLKNKESSFESVDKVIYKTLNEKIRKPIYFSKSKDYMKGNQLKLGIDLNESF